MTRDSNPNLRLRGVTLFIIGAVALVAGTLTAFYIDSRNQTSQQLQPTVKEFKDTEDNVIVRCEVYKETNEMKFMTLDDTQTLSDIQFDVYSVDGMVEAGKIKAHDYYYTYSVSAEYKTETNTYEGKTYTYRTSISIDIPNNDNAYISVAGNNIAIDVNTLMLTTMTKDE